MIDGDAPALAVTPASKIWPKIVPTPAPAVALSVAGKRRSAKSASSAAPVSFTYDAAAGPMPAAASMPATTLDANSCDRMRRLVLAALPFNFSSLHVLAGTYHAHVDAMCSSRDVGGKRPSRPGHRSGIRLVSSAACCR